MRVPGTLSPSQCKSSNLSLIIFNYYEDAIVSVVILGKQISPKSEIELLYNEKRKKNERGVCVQASGVQGTLEDFCSAKAV